MDRRTWLRQAGTAAWAAASVFRHTDVWAQGAVPNSVGTARPRLQAPAGTCDCHHHIYDVRFPPPLGAVGNPFQPNARVEEYRLLQRRLGTSRSVVVTPAAYVTDNDVTLDAIKKLQPNTCGIALVKPDITVSELRTLAAAGVRGVRFGTRFPVDIIEAVARRAAEVGCRKSAQTASARDSVQVRRPGWGAANRARHRQARRITLAMLVMKLNRLSGRQIASVLGTTRGAVYVRLHRLRSVRYAA